MSSSRPTVVLIPSWGSGHFMSALEAGKRLLATVGGAFTLTVLVLHAPSEASASEVEGHVRREAASGLDIRFLQLPAVEQPTGCVDPIEFSCRYVQLQAANVKAAIAGLAPASRVAAVVVDLFLTTLFDVVHELAVPAYVYFASPAAFLSLMLRLRELREDLTGAGFEAMESTVDVPGLPPVPPSYMPFCLVKHKIQSYDWFEYHGRRFMEAKGVIVNTSVELEGSVLAAIAEGRCVPGRPAPALHAIGPVIWFGSTDNKQPHECVRWLDAQPPASVVFLCFGSMGTLDAAQVREVAAGLERSGHRFLWVLRGEPVAGTRLPTDADLEELLPEGFLEATAERGAGVAGVGAAEGDPGPRRRGRLRDALRMELHPGEPVVRRADDPVAAVRGAAPERVRAGGRRGRGGGAGDGPEEGVLRGGGGAGAGGAEPDGRRVGGGEGGEEDGRGGERRVPEGRRRWRLVVRRAAEARARDFGFVDEGKRFPLAFLFCESSLKQTSGQVGGDVLMHDQFKFYK